MNGAQQFLILLASAVIISLVLAIVIAYHGFGPFTIKHWGHDLKWLPCRYCTAGTQWWDGRKWTHIPKHARVVQDGSEIFHSIQANVRKCPHCQLGGHWADRGAQESRTNEIEPGPGDFN